MSTSNAIANYLWRRMAEAQGLAPDAAPRLTERGLRYFTQMTQSFRKRIDEYAPVQQTLKGEGWQIFEAEIVSDIKELWKSATENILSPDPQKREQAMMDFIVARALNERVLKRVNRTMLDTMIFHDAVESMELMRKEYAQMKSEE